MSGFNLARIKKGEDTFEIVIDPEQAALYKEGKAEVRDVLKAEDIYADAKKGMLASEENLKARFDTDDALVIAKEILDRGEIQYTAEQRQKGIQEKYKQLVNYVHVHGVDPKTKIPHPVTRIENAFEEAKIRVDSHKSVEAQAQDALKKLRVIIPIKFVMKEISIKIPPENAGKAYGIIRGMGELKREEWLKDGSWQGIVVIPGGLEADLYEKINGATHGKAELKVLDTR